MAPKKGSLASNQKEAKPVWVVLICGLPGSGKSRLRARLVENGWAYVCQDEMATTEACEKALVKALKAGRSCVVDRCNVTSSDRRLWLQYIDRATARGAVKGVSIHVEAIWMATPPELCKKRAAARPCHETLSPESSAHVIDGFMRRSKPPERSGQEPYEAVHFVLVDSDADLLVRRYVDPGCVDATLWPACNSALAVATATLPLATSVEGHGSTCADELEEESRIEPQISAAKGLCAELFVIRHGERADRATGRVQEWADDSALTKHGREKAKAAGSALRLLASSPWAAVYSSPFYRCLQTANEIAAEIGLPVRVEPGLAELCSNKVFDHEPLLRDPSASLQGALTRVDVDVSVAPVQSALPPWPESGGEATSRVVGIARALALRHPGRAVCLVCHSHSLVEITRHIPVEGGGMAGSTSDYCALSHISNDGVLRRCLDMHYLKTARHRDNSAIAVPDECPDILMEGTEVGSWATGWRWTLAGQESEIGLVEDSLVEVLLEMNLDEALVQYPKFREAYASGSIEKQDLWRQSWANKNDTIRHKLSAALAKGIFTDPGKHWIR